MRAHWKIVKLGDVSAINYGYTAKASFEDVGPKFLRITDIQNGNVDWHHVPKCPISDQDLEKHRLRNKDIVFARTRATTGKSYLINDPPESVAASYLIRLRIKTQEIFPEFIALYFQSKEYWDAVARGMSGSAQGGFNASKLSAMHVPVPPLPEQKRIVAILDEAFAGLETAVASTEKNFANAREVFESYLSKIEFRKKPLGEFVEITTGKLNANAAVENGHYPFFTCSREVFRINDYAFDCEAILLAGNNASGDFNVKHYSGKFNAYQRTYVIKITDDRELAYRFLYYQLIKSLKELKANSDGIGTRFLKIGIIKNLEISVPSMKQQKDLLLKLEELESDTKRLESIYNQKLTALAELKQSLLQKAFSGELTAKIDNTGQRSCSMKATNQSHRPRRRGMNPPATCETRLKPAENRRAPFRAVPLAGRGFIPGRGEPEKIGGNKPA